jgi:sirohydrochlorin cobaltochelatase
MNTTALKAIVLFGHGARNPAWAKPMEAIASSMRMQTELPIRVAFLEFMKPSLADVCAELAQMGVSTVYVMPAFLAGAGHLMNDLPGLLEEIKGQLPTLTIIQKSALGDRTDVIHAISASFLGDL